MQVAAGRQRGQGGFSLIEVLVAVTILGVAYVAILQSFSMSLHNLARMKESRAVLLQDYLAFEARLVPMKEGEQSEKQRRGKGEELFLKGNIYELWRLDSESGAFNSVKLEKLQL